jgi:hypothetical protein
MRAGLVNSLTELDRYRWTGHASLVGQVVADWQDVDFVLEQFGRRVGAARGAYRRFVEDGWSQGRRPELTGGGLRRSRTGWQVATDLERGRERWTFDERVLGSSQFVTQLLVEAQVVQLLGGISDGKTALAQVIRRVAERLELTEAEVCGGQRLVSLQVARAVVAYLAVRRAGLAVGQVAGALRVSRPTVWRGVRAGPSVLDRLGITADELLVRGGAGQA